MKRYIYFAYSIAGMGGAQQYYKNRVMFLQSQGYHVELYSAIPGEIKVSELQQFEENIIPELNYIPRCIKKKKRDSILQMIAGSAQAGDTIYVESVGGYPTLWAELVAEKIGGKHICFSVSEYQNAQHSPKMIQFFYYKYCRSELFGIKPDSLSLLFKGVHDVPISRELSFSAACTDVIDEGTPFDITFPDADYTIGGIWRTNKDGFIPTMEQLLRYVQENPHNKYNVVIVGGGSIDNENAVKRMFDAAPNANIIILGYLYPIPKELILKVDVFVSTAGSARVPMYCGKPTISVTTDAKGKFYPLGIYNYTTTNTLTPEDTGHSLSDYMRMVLTEGYCFKNKVISEQLLTPGDIQKSNTEQMEKFKIASSKEYYDVMMITPESFKDKINCLLCKTIGANGTIKIAPLLHKLRSRLNKEK